MPANSRFLLLVLLLTFGADALAQTPTPPYIRSFSSSPIVYPGQQFRLYVEADNHNLNDHRTAYIQYQMTDPGVFEYVPESAVVPETNDFFEGEDMADVIAEPTEGFGLFGYRFDLGNGVRNRNGYIAQYDWIVPPGLSGSYSFLLDEEATTMNDANAEPQERTLYSDTITIADGGDANLDGQVDVGDLKLLAGHWMLSGLDLSTSWLSGDFNSDGSVNVDDLGIMALNWSSNASSGLALAEALDSAGIPAPVPEPSLLSVLALPAVLLLRRRR